MKIPENVTHLLRRLTDRGYEAYAVGGCVRDTLLGRTPGDWDICTSAMPEETEACFRPAVIETGLKHGTVTVLLKGEQYEITTFRRDGAYADHRRPEQVDFVRDLREDLSRRDFTVNAMAAGADGAIIDLFEGRADLGKKLLRCVGDPDRRFQEDALRILRGLRFASQLGFSVEERTACAMEENKELLSCVSGERTYAELTKLLTGTYAPAVLEEYGTVLLPVLPEIGPAMGFPQYNPCHDRDVWGHTLRALELSPADPVIRWTLLLHDLGKPDCLTIDDKGIGHFHGHPQRSAEIAEGILQRLHVDTKTRETVCELVRRHDEGAPVTKKGGAPVDLPHGTGTAAAFDAGETGRLPGPRQDPQNGGTLSGHHGIYGAHRAGAPGGELFSGEGPDDWRPGGAGLRRGPRTPGGRNTGTAPWGCAGGAVRK